MIHCEFENGKKASLRHVTCDTVVLKDNKVLLVKRSASLLEGGKWGVIGGYVERDETGAEAAMREVFEETGYRAKNLQLLTIRDNPDRPKEDRQNVSFVYFCEAGEKEGKPDNESTEQEWFSLESLPRAEEMAFDHFDDIELYKKYLSERFALPLIST